MEEEEMGMADWLFEECEIEETEDGIAMHFPRIEEMIRRELIND